MKKLFNALTQPDDKTCLPTCLAMIVDESIEYVLEWFKHYGVVPNMAEDGIIFLVHHGIFLATYARAKGGGYFELNGEKDLNIPYKIKDCPALVAVLSERFPGKFHSVFWTGKKVLDPNPYVKEPRSLDSYKIVELWPLIMTEQRYQSSLKRGL